MAVYNPPLEDLPIFDTAQFVETTEGSGLTQGQANLLYLKKTTPDTAIAEETFNAGIKTDDILSITNTLNIGTSLTNIIQNGQTLFNDLVPHCDIVPEYFNDLCNKAYVDSRVSSGGNLQLFFNYSVVQSGVYSALEPALVTAPVTKITTDQSLINIIASFLTDADFPNVLTIPSGLWELNQFGNVDGNLRAGTLNYFFKLYKGDIGSFTLLGQSGLSSDIDAKSPTLYFAELALGELTLLATDRLLIEIYSIGVGTGGSHTMDTYYQGDYFSYITCPLLSGSNLLLKNNTWIGTNSFTALTTMAGATLSGATNLTLTSGIIKLGSFTGTRTSDMIGFIHTGTTITNGTYPATGTNRTLSTLTLPSGSYILYGVLEMATFTTLTTNFVIQFGKSGSIELYGKANYYTPVVTRNGYNVTAFITLTDATTPVLFNTTAVYTSTVPAYYAGTSYCKAIRIG